MGLIGLLMVVFWAVFIFWIICAIRESKVTSPYYNAGVYTRFSAYMALNFSMVGIALTFGPWLTLLIPDSKMEDGIPVFLVCSLIGLLLFGIGVLIYRHAYKKCPRHLKSKCVGSMIITGFGVSMKLGVFFVGSVWKIYATTVSSGGTGFASSYCDDYGNEYYLGNTSGRHAILISRFSSWQVTVHLSEFDNERCFDDAGNVYYPIR